MIGTSLSVAAIAREVLKPVAGEAIKAAKPLDRFRMRLGITASQLAARRALKATWRRLRQAHGGAAADLFDEHFLKNAGAPFLRRCIGDPELPTSDELVSAWAAQLPPQRHATERERDRMRPVARDLLAWFREELRKEEDLWPALTRRAAESAADDTRALRNDVAVLANSLAGPGVRLLGPPRTVMASTEGDGQYRLGVERESPDALVSAGLDPSAGAPYVGRDVDELLAASLSDAAGRRRAELIVLAGPAKAGKSRTLTEALRRALPTAWLLVPANPRALVALGREPMQLEPVEVPCVVWLDDLEPWVGLGDSGLNEETLRAFDSWERPVLLAATQGGKGCQLAGETARRFAEPIRALADAHLTAVLNPWLSTAELERLTHERDGYSAAAVDALADEGIGAFMIAARELLARVDSGECPEGTAIVRAAADLRRAGILRPIPCEWLEHLYRFYLAGPHDQARFDRGLAWATAPVHTVSLLRGRGPYEPHDFVVRRDSERSRPIPHEVWGNVLAKYAQPEELTRISIALLEDRNEGSAEDAFRRGDRRGHVGAANNLGMLLLGRGDIDGAEAAFRRAHDRGDLTGTTNLGMVLNEYRNDSTSAEAFLRAADEHGHPEAAVELAAVLVARGARDEALAALHRADDRGSARGAHRLGEHFERAADLLAAQAAFARADARGHAQGAFDLGSILLRRARTLESSGQFAEAATCVRDAEAAFERGMERGHLGAATNLVALLEHRGASARAESLAKRTDEGGDPGAAYTMAYFHHKRGDNESAIAALRRAIDRSSGHPAFNEIAVKAAAALADLIGQSDAPEKGPLN